MILELGAEKSKRLKHLWNRCSRAYLNCFWVKASKVKIFCFSQISTGEKTPRGIIFFSISTRWERIVDERWLRVSNMKGGNVMTSP